MKLGNWEATADLNPIYAEIRRLGLEQNIAEHDAFGFTIVPPEKVAPPEVSERLRKAILAVHERRTGEHIDVADIETTTLGGKAPLTGSWQLLGEDPVFEEAMMNPTVLALARYFLGKSVQASGLVSMIKRKDETPTHVLHTDQHGTPPPLPPYLQFLNVTWILTPYSYENGSTAFVPGSHRFGRMPEPYEENYFRNDAPFRPVPVECDAGSLLIWGGTTWHASFPRKNEGVRINLSLAFSRIYMRQIRDLPREVPQDVIDRNPPEFARLIGLKSGFPHLPGGKTRETSDIRDFIEAGSTPWG